jgi:hypothetical protein
MPVVLQPPRGLLHQVAQPVHFLPQGEHLVELFGCLLPAPPSDERVGRLEPNRLSVLGGV